MKAEKAPYRFFPYALAAMLCALPFLLGSVFLYRYAERVDILPLEVYEGLRWSPGGKGLAFLHRPLRSEPPAPTEVWWVGANGGDFRQIAALPAGTEWELTRQETDSWMFATDRSTGGDTSMALIREGDEVKLLRVEPAWSRLPSQGKGLYFQSVDENLPFDQFVDVEEAPHLQPEAEEELSEEQPPELPTRSGLKIARYDPEADSLETLLSIPYNKPEEQPIVHLVRRSPDARFLALAVQFGQSGSPGLWIHDSESRRLLWTRVVLDRDVHGIDWSSDSVKVAVTDGSGVSILEQALGIQSVRLDVIAGGALRPKWGSGTNLYLVNQNTVYRVEENRGQASPLFDLRAQYQAADDLVLDPINEIVAFSASPKGFRELFIRELRSGQTVSRVAYPGSLKQKAQGTVAYQLGNAIRFAWKRWTGSSEG